MITQTHTKSYKPTLAIETHGCKLNQADSLVLSTAFSDAGFIVVPVNHPSDVYVLNSCTVTHVADQKARQALRAARRRNPHTKIVATGCYAQNSGKAIDLMPEVDLVVGNFDKKYLAQKILDLIRSTSNDYDDFSNSDDLYPKNSRTRAMIKIQEGCNQVCAYCIVPKVRGREKSVPASQLITQINNHVSAGYKEVVLTGTQLGSYGFDLPDIDLRELVQLILSETDLIRLRISSLQPQEIDSSFLELWSDERLCPHFHLALQSGSDNILKHMRRRYTARQYTETVEMIRSTVPDVSITTDVIVGFPGESDTQFLETYNLCKEIMFSKIHVFPYSIRPGTSASYFKNQTTSKSKSDRVKELISLSEKHSINFKTQFIGKTRSVLWESLRHTNDKSSNYWVGLTDNYIRVSTFTDRNLANNITSAVLLKTEDELVLAEVT